MPGREGQPQKRASGTKKSDQNVVELPEVPERETPGQATEDDSMLDDDTGTDPPRSNTSSIRRGNLIPSPRTTTQHSSPIPQRRTGTQLQQPNASLTAPITTRPYQRDSATKQQPPSGNRWKGKVHWLLPAGVGMIAMLVLWVVGSAVLAWGLARYDDIRYGNPRTYQTDAVVGHGGDSAAHPSHFIAINLNRQALVVEFPAGNPNGAQSYVVPYYILGQGGDLRPITLEFRDVTGDGKLDMIIHIHLQNQDQTFVFVNTGTKFRPPNSKDNIHL